MFEFIEKFKFEDLKICHFHGNDKIFYTKDKSNIYGYDLKKRESFLFI